MHNAALLSGPLFPEKHLQSTMFFQHFSLPQHSFSTFSPKTALGMALHVFLASLLQRCPVDGLQYSTIRQSGLVLGHFWIEQYWLAGTSSVLYGTWYSFGHFYGWVCCTCKVLRRAESDGRGHRAASEASTVHSRGRRFQNRRRSL